MLTGGEAHDIQGFGPLFRMLGDRITALLGERTGLTVDDFAAIHADALLGGREELRHLAPPPLPPGGFTGGMPPGGGFGFYQPTPSWYLHPTVLVTGIKSVPGKR